MTAHRTPLVNHCYAVPLRGGRWGACQVLSVGKEGADVVAVDWVGKRRPTLKQLASAKPLVLTHHAHRERPERCYASGPVPAEFVALGERAPLVTTAMQPPSYGAWGNFGLQARLQHRWDHEVPKAEIARYRAGDQPITLGETTRLPSYNTTVGAAPDAHFPWPAGEPVPWQALDVAGTLTKLTYHGRDPGVIAYVASRKLIAELTWREHGQASLDFRGASLIDLRLDVPKRLRLSIDEDVERLSLSGHAKGRAVTVEHPRGGEELELSLAELPSGALPPAVKGLERLSSLDLCSVKLCDLKALAKAYPALRQLTVRGKYARLQHPEALANLKQLESLTLYDVYDLDVAALPPPDKLPTLNHFCFSGLRKSDAQLLRARFGGLRDLEVRGAKNDAWIAANCNNPLRDWVDADEAFGERACKLFSKAYRAASTASGVAGKPGAAGKSGVAAAKPGAAAKKALTDFVKAINKLDAQYELIDTIRREEAYEAYAQLVALTHIDQAEADSWFSELCEF